MEMGWVSGSGCILKDHLVVYQNALHKSCKNIYFEQQDVRLFTEEWREIERERGVWEGEREKQRQKQRGWEGREREEKLLPHLPSFIPHPQPTQTPGCGIASLHVFAWLANSGATWALASTKVTTVGGKTYINHTLFFSVHLHSYESIHLYSIPSCRQTQVLWKACRDETRPEPCKAGLR